jgi:hypothetical protein
MKSTIILLGIALGVLLTGTLPANAQRILDGEYGFAPTDGGLTVKGKKYQEYGEGYFSKWQPVSKLKSIKKGVIQLPNGNYFCLSSMIKRNLPSGSYAVCDAKGWVYKGRNN